MGRSSAKIYVTKIAAARRQLCAAIRMFFAQEDELAVHNVASAAYRVLRDLKAKRGKDEVDDVYYAAIFYTVRDYRRNNLPPFIRDDPENMKEVREMADQLPITASSKYEDFALSVSRDVARDYWRKQTAAWNFLKHADRDASSHICLDDVDNLDLILKVLNAYTDLTDDRPPEGFVFWVYFNTVKDLKEQMPEKFRKYATNLEELEPDEQMEFCRQLVERMKDAESDGG